MGKQHIKMRRIDNFNVYEYSAIICPGAMFFIGLLLMDGYYGYSYNNYIKDLSFCSFVLLLIASFCVGNVLQGIANIFEDLFWKPEKLTKKVLKKEGINVEWHEAYRYIRKNKSTDRIDIFNKQYGLMRGLFICFLILSIIAFAFFSENNGIPLLLASFASAYRAYHFAKLYARELAEECKIVANEADFKISEL